MVHSFNLPDFCFGLQYEDNTKAKNNGCPKKCVLDSSSTIKLVISFSCSFLISRGFLSSHVNGGSLLESNESSQWSQFW
jgi:hypothetical protein